MQYPQPQFRDEPTFQTAQDLDAFELITCPIHPNYRVEAFCPKDTLKSGLLCIKCILHPDISKEIRSDSLIAIKDLISKSAELATNASYQSDLDAAQESFDKKFLDYSTKDYVASYDRHVETQMSKLDQELDRIREALNGLREQFVQFFQNQAETLRKADEEFKQKALEYFEEKEKLEKMTFGSVYDILRELTLIPQFVEYEKFIRVLYDKLMIARGDKEASLTKKMMNMMEDVKTQASGMRTLKVDTKILEGNLEFSQAFVTCFWKKEIRMKIESINILDKSTVVAGVPSLTSSLEKTLDKVRKLEKKSVAQEIVASIQRFDRRDKDSSEKANLYSDSDLKKPSALSRILKEKYGVDNLKKLAPGQIQPANRPSSYQKNEDTWRTSTSSSNIAIRANRNIDEMSPGYGFSKKLPMEQPKDRSWLIGQRAGNDSEGVGEDAPPSRKLVAKDRGVGFQQNLRESQMSFAQSSQQSQRISPSPTRAGAWGNDEDQNASPKFAEIAQKRPKETMEEENGGSQSKSPSKSVTKESAKDIPKGSLVNQWIDQKVNGFLIFQNTLREQTEGPMEDFNKYASEKWFHLSKPERDEYSVLALNTRAELKQEFQALSESTSDINQLQELLEQRIKLLKK